MALNRGAVGFIFGVVMPILLTSGVLIGVIIWAIIKDSSSSSVPVKPQYDVVNATMANIAYRDDRLTADFSFTLSALNFNKNNTVDFTNSTEATALYFDREAVVATSTALPIPSSLPPKSSDNLFTFGLHAQDATLDARNSGFARLEVKLMARLDGKSMYRLLKVICRRLKYSSQGFEVKKENRCFSYYRD